MEVGEEVMMMPLVLLPLQSTSGRAPPPGTATSGEEAAAEAATSTPWTHPPGAGEGERALGEAASGAEYLARSNKSPMTSLMTQWVTSQESRSYYYSREEEEGPALGAAAFGVGYLGNVQLTSPLTSSAMH